LFAGRQCAHSPRIQRNARVLSLSCTDCGQRCVRFLVIGAYGLIGSIVSARLRASGWDVVGVGRDVARARRSRPDVSWIERDLRDMTTPEAWVDLLAGVDAVVNCAGALKDNPRDDLSNVHEDARSRARRRGERGGASGELSPALPDLACLRIVGLPVGARHTLADGRQALSADAPQRVDAAPCIP
jgi:hypothetical protein